jgi:anti-sigma B factor antagonist
MDNKLFNKKSQNGVYLSKKFYQTNKVCKYKSMYDSFSDNTIVILEIDRATVYEAKEFYEGINELLENGNHRIIIDIESVYFMDSVFFGTLIKLLKQADKKLGYIKLIVDHASRPELLSISNFQGIFDIYPNMFEAVNESRAS